MATVAILGLGEAGTEFALDLAGAGAVVRGYDPRVGVPDVVIHCSDEASAAEGCDLVLSVNSAHDAMTAMKNGIGAMPETAVWADLNTGSAELKRALQSIAIAHNRLFADVAMMAPVPGNGVRTPMLVSGDGASRVAELLAPFGSQIEVLDGPAGTAAARKLLRSVFYKGMAAAVVEAIRAADAAGEGPWLRSHVREQLNAADGALLDRLVSGSYRHARRRAEEMRAAADMLRELGISPHIAAASAALLDELR